jgi:signal transduction histidine kinase
MRPLPKLSRRLFWVSALGSLAIVTAVAAAAALAVDEEVEELLDDGLRASADQLAPLLVSPALRAEANPRFAWVWFDSAGRRVSASPGAEPHWQPREGFADDARWRLFGEALPGQRGWLLVAQSRAERREARAELLEFSLFAGLGVLLLGLPLLAWRQRAELRPLARMAARLAGFDAEADPRQLAAQLGPAQREELQALQQPLVRLGERLGERLAFEREFSAQAAHLLRTPLAGMDVQLAVALKELPGDARLLRVREAGQRLQQLVTGLLRLFRAELQREPLDARALLAGLPLDGLMLEAGPPCPVRADAALLGAALLTLADNAQRHGARQLRLSQPAPQCLQLDDDGRGADAAVRERLQAQLAGEPSADAGLGLRLAQLVARAHGGRLELPPTAQGFSVRIHL